MEFKINEKLELTVVDLVIVVDEIVDVAEIISFVAQLVQAHEMLVVMA